MNLLKLLVEIGAKDNASKTIDNMANKATQSISAFAVAFGNIISNVVTAGWNEFVSGIDAGISRVDTLHQFNDTMVALGESTEDAAVAVDRIKKGLDGLPSRTSDIADFVGQIKSTGIGLDEATQLGLAFNDAMLAGGKGTQYAARAQDAYTKMLASGKVDLNYWYTLIQTAPAQMNQLAESILGAGHSYADLQVALKDGSVSLDDFNKALIDNAEAFHTQAEAATSGIETSIENFSNRIGKMWENIIEIIGPERIAGLLDGISHHFSAWGTKIGNVIKPVADAFFALTDSILKVWDSTTTLVEEVSGPIERAITPFEKIQMLGEAISENVPPLLSLFGDIVMSAIEQLKTYMPTIVDAVVAFVEAVIDIIKENGPVIMEAAMGFFGQALQGLAKVAPSIINGFLILLLDLIGYVISHVPDMLEAVLTFIATFGQGIQEKAPEFFEKLVTMVADGVKAVLDFAKPFLEAGAELWGELIGGIMSKLDSMLTTVRNGIQDAVNGVLSFVGNFLSAGAELINNIIGGIASVIGNVASTVSGGISDAVAAVGSFVGEMWSAGYNVVQGIIDGIWSNIGNVASTILSGFRGAVDTVKSFLGIASPSKLFAEIGKNTMLGMAEGIEDNMAKAENAMRSAAEDIYGAASGSVSIGASAGILGGSNGIYGIPSINIYGDITVVADDPQDFMDQLTDMARQARRQYA